MTPSSPATPLTKAAESKTPGYGSGSSRAVVSGECHFHAEHERRPGSEKSQYLPAMWPATPSVGHWGGRAWLDTHAKLVEHVQARKGPIDIILVGDSITQQWGSVLDGKPLNAAWQKHFGPFKTINIGIGGDKTQNVLWRLDHGGVDGLAIASTFFPFKSDNCPST